MFCQVGNDLLKFENKPLTSEDYISIVFIEILSVLPGLPDKGVYLKLLFLISQPKHMLWVLKSKYNEMQCYMIMSRTLVKSA